MILLSKVPGSPTALQLPTASRKRFMTNRTVLFAFLAAHTLKPMAD